MSSSDIRIIVVGTSAGGMQALIRLLAKLPEDLPAAILVVQHLSVDSSAPFLVNRISRHTPLTCKVAEHNTKLEAGVIYLAPADRHLLLSDKKMLVMRGPRENQFRPAIDPLFRSAAAYKGSHVIGIILTGFMTDEVIGMESIKRSGGITIVQHPDDAEFPALPQNVIRKIDTDYIIPVDEMAGLLQELVQQTASDTVAIPADIWQEAQITERIMTYTAMSNIEDLENAGTRTAYSCPDCGGGLWELSQEGSVSRYRCHSGHAYNQDALLHGMSGNLEETLWVAMRTLEERHNILLHMSQNVDQNGNGRWSSMQRDRAEEMKVHIERLRQLLAQSSLSEDENIGKAV